jgi:hypothetical protein
MLPPSFSTASLRARIFQTTIQIGRRKRRMSEMRGSITASCGHILGDNEPGESVIYGGENCDAVDGFQPCLFYAHFCQKCADEWRARGWLLKNETEADAWLDRYGAKAQLSGKISE